MHKYLSATVYYNGILRYFSEVSFVFQPKITEWIINKYGLYICHQQNAVLAYTDIYAIADLF